jgi:excisionase family DNA binding protein
MPFKKDDPAARKARKLRGGNKQRQPALPPDYAPRTPIGEAVQRRFLTREEAAKYLGVSVAFVIKKVKTKELIEYHLGPFTRRYRVEDVESYLAARRSADVAALLS